MMMITCLIGGAVRPAFASSAAQARSAPARAATQAPTANLYFSVPIAASIHSSLLDWLTIKEGMHARDERCHPYDITVRCSRASSAHVRQMVSKSHRRFHRFLNFHLAGPPSLKMGHRLRSENSPKNTPMPV